MNIKAIIGTLLAFLFAFEVLGFASSADRIDLQVASEQAIKVVNRISRYDSPHSFDGIITSISKDELFDRMGCTGNCTAYGFYDHDNNIIYMSQDLGVNLDAVQQMGWIVHEHVHYAQHRAGIDLLDCFGRQLIELEAYAVQSAYLVQMGGYPVSNYAAFGLCE